ncbi:conserved hypothetical protein [Mucor ambiguus]|uniref:CCHC-type domain-containing protein n=1 Tax=Mucor ambiguus TaxID=91626 RepID=A0A0C9MK15_9FUNG|nr:conserved hypothetical protein [Mucor ambiguus]
MMFDGDEEELELLRQYEDKDLAEDDDNKSSKQTYSKWFVSRSDDMDSDLEDKIMSMVQYGSGISKKKALDSVPPLSKTQDANPPEQSNVQAKVVYAPIDNDIEDSQKTAVSSADIYQIDDSDSEDGRPSNTVYSDNEEDEGESEEEETDIGVPELTADIPTKTPADQPQVTRFINLDEEEKRYMDDEDTSEEEAELESKLQQLIDDQIYNRQSKRRFHERPVRVCFNCHTPGHERIDCKICMDCGMLKHKDSRCVGARYCSKCKFRGHNAIDCTNARTYESCRHCGATYHHSNMCPSILHTYVGEVTAKSTPVAWCYNCTERGHYGDDCPDLPQYKTTMPSAFSKLSLGLGSRFDPKKAKKSSSSSYHGSNYTANKHQRWSDSSRESSPRYDHHDSRKRARYNYNDSDDDYNNSRYTRRDNGSSSKSNNNNSNSNSSNNNNSNNNNNNNYNGKKRQKTNNQQGLDGFFSHQQQQASASSSSRNSNNNNNNSRSGNNNWKAMNNNSLPQPTRSGTVKVNSYGRQQQQRQDYGDFPRGNNNTNNLPRPSASGVIDLTGDRSSSSNKNNNRGGGGGAGGGEYSSNRRPKYHGGYSRNR